MSKDSWKNRWKLLWSAAKARHGNKLKIRAKAERAWMWNLFTYLLDGLVIFTSFWPFLFTWGKKKIQRGPDLLNTYYTTIGDTLWTPGDGTEWEELDDRGKYILLSHEIDHFDFLYFGDHALQDHKSWDIRMKRSYLRAAWYGFLYLVLPLWRRKVEAWGYSRNLRVRLVAGEGKLPTYYKDYLRGVFTGPHYFYMANNDQFEKLYRDMHISALIDYEQGDLDHLKPITEADE